jgi:hypothetical protein
LGEVVSQRYSPFGIANAENLERISASAVGGIFFRVIRLTTIFVGLSGTARTIHFLNLID